MNQKVRPRRSRSSACSRPALIATTVIAATMPAKVVKTSADISRISLANAERTGTASGVFTAGDSALGSFARCRPAGWHRLCRGGAVHRTSTLRECLYSHAPEYREDEHRDPEVGRLAGR